MALRELGNGTAIATFWKIIEKKYTCTCMLNFVFNILYVV